MANRGECLDIPARTEKAMSTDTHLTGNLHDAYVRFAGRTGGRNTKSLILPSARTWEQERPDLHRRFMKSLGLDPMPERGDLGAFETGRFQGAGYTGKKLAYQLLPNCWGSAHFYRPAGLPEETPTPAVLYTCGHTNIGVVGLQEHAIAWARRGYSCLIFDTIEQHDNPGEHHGLNLGLTPEWIAMGYSAAGGEVFNGLRALDLLLEQPGVDRKRVGVTGISGGGSQSFFLAVADNRLAAVATVAGVSDPAYAIPNRQVLQHCDCIYLRNIFARDIAEYAALIAPGALLYCFARQDTLFTPGEFRDLYRRTRARFESLNCGDRCALHEYDGPHGYNESGTTDAIHDWFDLHVAGEPHAAVDTLAIAERAECLGELSLSVFHGRTVEPNHLHLLPDLLAPGGQWNLPREPAGWPALQALARTRLREEIFPLLDAVEASQNLVCFGDWRLMGKYRRQAWRGSLDGMEQCLFELAPADDSHQRVIVALGGREQEALALTGLVWDQLGPEAGTSVLAIEPRACGVHAFPAAQHNHLNREGCLVGMTPTMLVVQDLHLLWPMISELPSVRDRSIVLYGRGEGGLALLFHALMHPLPQVEAVILEDLPGSFAGSAFQIMGVLRVMNVSHAVGLLAPTPVALVNPASSSFHWSYASRAHDRAGSQLLVGMGSLRASLEELGMLKKFRA